MSPRSSPTPRDPCGVTPVAAPDLVLGPATRLLWRSPEQIHLEMGPRSVVVDGLPVEVIRQVASRTSNGAVRPQDDAVRAALVTLGEAGYLWSRTGEPDDPRLHPPTPRLSGELASLAVQYGPDAAELLQARRNASVEVHGSSKVAVQLAAVLAAAGVGRVRCVAAGDVRLVHTAPGGLLPADEGRLRAAGADEALHRAAPEVDTTPLPTDERPDLTVLALDSPVPDERRDSLHSAAAPHLSVTLGLEHGVVGPLVLPGLTSCLRCADLLRTDRDPAWRALAVQLATPQRYGSMSGVAAATVVAGIAAVQALAFLDGGEPATIDGTLELRLPDWRVRRRSWAIHPDCDCCTDGPDAPAAGRQ